MGNIILIGGAPTIGKSYVAKKIAEKIKLPWISTDTIRETMRGMVSKDEYSNLFRFSSSVTAEKYLTTHTPKQIFGDQNLENKEVWKGALSLIEGDYVWKDFIIEGSAIMPLQVNKLMSRKKNVKAIFLFNDDKEKIRKVIFNRGLWDEAKNYSDKVKEIEVKWVMLCNNWIKKEAQRYGLPLYEYSRDNEGVNRIIRLVK